MKGYFLVLSLNPVIQKTFVFQNIDIGEVNRCSEYYVDAAGKGVNVARILMQLGEEAILVSHAGGREKDYYLSLVAQDDIPVRIVDSSSDVRTCYTLLEKGAHTTTEIVEESKPVAPGTDALVRTTYTETLGGSKAVIITGTQAEGYSDSLYPDCVRDAKKAGKMVVLDIKGKSLLSSLQFRPDIIKPNLAEFAGTFFPEKKVSEQGEHQDVVELCAHMMAELYKDYGTLTVLTMGKRGVLFFNGERVKKIDASPIVPVNTIGCGDAFTAGLSASLLLDHDIEKAVMQGQACAEKNALFIKPGTIR